MELSQAEARSVMVHALGLNKSPSRAATKTDALNAIRRMGALQIDTIHVVARSPYLVLWSRLGEYDPSWLDDLLADGKLFEYWSHEACFLPIEDYPLYRHWMLAPESLGWKYSREWVAANRAAVEHVLSHIRAHGPTRAADFERTDGKAGGWWEWKPEKRALEMLFSAGELMIAARHNFQRVYDLRERVLPGWDDSGLPPYEETRRALILKAVRALGVSVARWVSDYFRTDKSETAKLTKALADEGKLLRLKVSGWDEVAYAHPDALGLIEQVLAGSLRPTLTTFLSPFDPLVWDRVRARKVFGFDYRIECYTPAAKRQYGYFVLPILHQGNLVGRLDPKAHRKEGRLEIKSLHLEPNVRLCDELVSGISDALVRFASWHKTPEVTIQKSTPSQLAVLIRQKINHGVR